MRLSRILYSDTVARDTTVTYLLYFMDHPLAFVFLLTLVCPQSFSVFKDALSLSLSRSTWTPNVSYCDQQSDHIRNSKTLKFIDYISLSTPLLFFPRLQLICCSFR